MSIAISLKNVSKSYNMYEKPQDRLKEIMTLNKKVYHKKFWALKDITFSLEKGKTIGIIGKNGSGKSTLLQLICGTIQSTTGEVIIDGRISALLELGTGFNPEFTGRQNVYMYCSIMGLSKKETDDRFMEIEKFAEIGEFIDQPVKTYSSGMYVRLAFSAAVNVDPDVFIVDEALSVGDMYFQLKCINKIKEFKKEGKTILFVTHDTYTVKNICDYAIWINNGRIELEGEVGEVVDEYEKFTKRLSGLTTEVAMEELPDIGQNEILRINKVGFFDNQKNERSEFNFNDDVNAVIEYEIFKDIKNIVAGIALFDSTGHYICGINTKLDNFNINDNIGKHKLRLSYNNIRLLPGVYFIDVGFFENTGVARLDYKSKCANFNIDSDKYLAEGNILLDHKWRCSYEY